MFCGESLLVRWKSSSFLLYFILTKRRFYLKIYEKWKKKNKNIIKQKGIGKENITFKKNTLSKKLSVLLIKKKKKLLFLRFLEVFFFGSSLRKIMARDGQVFYRPDFCGICPFFSFSYFFIIIYNLFFILSLSN